MVEIRREGERSKNLIKGQEAVASINDVGENHQSTKGDFLAIAVG